MPGLRQARLNFREQYSLPLSVYMTAGIVSVEGKNRGRRTVPVPPPNRVTPRRSPGQQQARTVRASWSWMLQGS